jgi:hypothetical protein
MAFDVKSYSCLSKLNVGRMTDTNIQKFMKRVLCSAVSDSQA